MSQKLIFKFKYLKLELEETNNLNEKYNQEFNKDFEEEIEYLNHINSQNSKKKDPNGEQAIIDGSQKDDSNIPSDFKEIYRLLIKELHPDLKTEMYRGKYEELLKRVTNAYEKRDWLEIIMIAHEEGVDIPNNLEIHNQMLENNLNELEEEILSTKNKLSWVWASTFKPNKKNKKEIYSLLNINKEKFEEWKNNKS
jgi:hypothetical protein